MAEEAAVLTKHSVRGTAFIGLMEYSNYAIMVTYLIITSNILLHKCNYDCFVGSFLRFFNVDNTPIL